MSFTMNAFDHAEWRRLGLAEFAERVRELEVQPDHDDQFEPDDQP